MGMRYLQSFNRRLRQFRESRNLSQGDLARLSQVEVSVVNAWEMEDHRKRSFPTVDNLLDLCLQTDTPLDYWLDMENSLTARQLELPGLAYVEESDLGPALDQLQSEISHLLPNSEEIELLRRFRRTSAENRKLIIQLMS